MSSAAADGGASKDGEEGVTAGEARLEAVLVSLSWTGLS